MSLAEAIETAVRGREVPGPIIEAAFGEIMSGAAGPAQIAGLLVALRTKGETVGEIVSVARALRAEASVVEVGSAAVDTCGTGGSGIDTFNISTTVAFVVAGAGVPVAKHGNRSASGRTGSFDTFEALGVRIDLPIETCGRILDEIGIAPFFARTAHPAFRHVAPVRSELGVRTLLNALGPLLNPAGARRQLVGVYDTALVRPLAEALGALGAERALVVHGHDGLDELTTTGPSHAALFDGGAVREIDVNPEALGLPIAKLEELRGGDARTNAGMLRAVLAGVSGAHRDIVVLNAGAVLWVAGASDDLAGGMVRAQNSLDEGAAEAKLESLIRATAEASAA